MSLMLALGEGRVGLSVPASLEPLALDLLAGLLSSTAALGTSVAEHVVVTETGGGLAVRRGEVEWLRTGDPDAALARALELVNAALVEVAPVPSVHAGVVEVDGVAVAFPADSGTGKSTFTAALLQAGARYLSDEALVLHPGGRVEPYPRPLFLAPGRAAALGLPAPTFRGPDEVAFAPGVLGPVAATADRPVLRHVVALVRGSGRPGLEPLPGGALLEPLPAGEVATLLLRNCFNHYRDPRAAFDGVADAVEGARGWTLTYDEAAEAAPRLLAALRAG